MDVVRRLPGDLLAAEAVLTEATHLLSRVDDGDTTLLTLAEELDLPRVFSLDHRGCSVYRSRGRTPFEILP